MKSVERGAEFLDERVPGWEERIDLDSLDLASSAYCVLGQLYLHEHPKMRNKYRAYEFEAAALGLDWDERDPSRFGFTAWGNTKYENLTTAWRRLIRRRRKS